LAAVKLLETWLEKKEKLKKYKGTYFTCKRYQGFRKRKNFGGILLNFKTVKQ